MKRMKPMIRPLMRFERVRDLFMSSPRLFRVLLQDFKTLFANEKEFSDLLNEIQNDAINNDLEQKLSIFNQLQGATSRGNPYISGTVSRIQAHRLYCIIRKRKPRVVVETGVCNGYSTTFILLALERNNRGKLYSIDFPEVAGTTYEEGAFWKGKGGAVIPKGKESGWLIPDALRFRWKLHLGKSQEVLPALVSELESVDLFFQDGEHSYECETFEFNQVWNKLTKSGLIFSHDIYKNSAFFDFAMQKGKETHFIDANLGFIIK